MQREALETIEVNDNGELLLKIEGTGDFVYQYVYREAAGVYWDNENHYFKSTPIKEWSIPRWYSHINKTIKNSLGVELNISNQTKWLNIPEDDKNEIKNNAI